MLSKEIRRAVDEVSQKNYWREPDAVIVMAAFEQFGGTLSGFARQCGLNVKRLYRWQRILDAKRGELTTASTPFHPVIVVDEEPQARSDGGLEVLVGGRRVSVHVDFDERTLTRLLKVLDANSC